VSEICGVSYQNKFVKLVHLIGFIIRKFVTMHGHMNVKFICYVMCLDPPSETILKVVDRNTSVSK